MPATSGDPARRRSRRDQPREWTGLDTAAGFERCVRATLRELYGYVALLCGRDRREAERLVSDVYRSLFRAVQAGHIGSVTLGALRSAGRRTWLEAHRDQLAATDEVSTAPASTIADLSMLERAVLVLRYVNGMSVERAAAELGRSERDVSVLSAHSVRRLRGTDDTSGAWLRAYLGPTVTPSGGLVDRIVGQLGAAMSPTARASQDPDAEIAGVTTDLGEAAGVGAAEIAEQPTEELTAVDLPGEPSAIGGAEPAESPIEELPTEELAAVDAADEPDEVGAVEPAELPTTELAIVDRPTVELPVVGPGGTDDVPAAGVVVDGGEASSEPEAGPERGRPRWIVVVGALLVAALVVALVWLALRGDAGETAESVGATSSPADDTLADGTAAMPATTAAPTTTPATTTPATTVASGPVELGFVPVCVERVGDEPPPVGWAETFGPLGDEPAVVLTLPESVDVAADPRRAAVRPSVLLRPDGAIVAVRPAAAHRTTQTMVARVGLDGTVAWVRCLDGDVTIGSQPDVGVELAVRSDGTWTALAVADGALGEPLDAVQSAVLDAPSTSSSDDGGPTLGSSYSADLQRTVPAVLDDGRVIWTASDVVLPESGGFRAAAVGEVVLAQSCVEVESGLDCAAGELRAFDLATGEQLWSRPGAHQLAASGGGVALLGDGSGWELVDVTTGAAVAGQRWDEPDAFAADQGAENADDGVSFVRQQGGAVVVARPGTVSVWLPAVVDVSPSAVELP